MFSDCEIKSSLPFSNRWISQWAVIVRSRCAIVLYSRFQLINFIRIFKILYLDLSLRANKLLWTFDIVNFCFQIKWYNERIYDFCQGALKLTNEIKMYWKCNRQLKNETLTRFLCLASWLTNTRTVTRLTFKSTAGVVVHSQNVGKTSYIALDAQQNLFKQ